MQDQWIEGTPREFLLPFTIPTGFPPGTLSLSVRCTDEAGNTATDTVSATIVSTLEGFVHNFLPVDNLMSLPIIPAIAGDTGFDPDPLTAEIDLLVADVLSPVDNLPAIDQILFYDATLVEDEFGDPIAEADRWTFWVPGGPSNSLSKLRTGRGYLVQMRADAFGTSEELAEGVPSTPAPIQLRYEGSFLLTGQNVPPIYPVEGKDPVHNPTGGAWNMVGFHSEDGELVSNYFQPLESPNRIWGAALIFKNLINFPLQAGATPEVVLGAFVGLLDTDLIEPGSGLWVLLLEDGVLVPR